MVSIKRTDVHGKTVGITGHNAMPFSWEQVEVRELKSGEKLTDLIAATRGNNLDEVIFETADGKYYVLFADELTSGTKRGDTIEIGGVTGKVVAVDDECNEDRWFVAAGVAATAGLVATGVFVAYGSAAALYTAAGIGASEVGLGTATLSVGGSIVSRGIGSLFGATNEDPATLLALTVPKKK